MAEIEWKLRGNCSKLSAMEADNLFFRSRGRPPASEQFRKFCDSCPVAERCLAYGIALKDRYGVWGGLTQRDILNLSPKIKKALLDKYQAPRVLVHPPEYLPVTEEQFFLLF